MIRAIETAAEVIPNTIDHYSILNFFFFLQTIARVFAQIAMIGLANRLKVKRKSRFGTIVCVQFILYTEVPFYMCTYMVIFFVRKLFT